MAGSEEFCSDTDEEMSVFDILERMRDFSILCSSQGLESYQYYLDYLALLAQKKNRGSDSGEFDSISAKKVVNFFHDLLATWVRKETQAQATYCNDYIVPYVTAFRTTLSGGTESPAFWSYLWMDNRQVSLNFFQLMLDNDLPLHYLDTATSVCLESFKNKQYRMQQVTAVGEQCPKKKAIKTALRFGLDTFMPILKEQSNKMRSCPERERAILLMTIHFIFLMKKMDASIYHNDEQSQPLVDDIATFMTAAKPIVKTWGETGVEFLIALGWCAAALLVSYYAMPYFSLYVYELSVEMATLILPPLIATAVLIIDFWYAVTHDEVAQINHTINEFNDELEQVAMRFATP